MERKDFKVSFVGGIFWKLMKIIENSLFECIIPKKIGNEFVTGF